MHAVPEEVKMTSKPVFCAFLSLAFVLAAADAAAQMYRWTDAQGRVHYTDMPPPKDAKAAEEKRLRANVVSGGDAHYGFQEALKRNPVRLYTTEKCEPCDEGRNFLSKRGVPFQETRLADNEEGKAQLKDFGGGLPVLTIGEQTRKGFAPESWEAALNAAGYSRYATAPKAAASQAGSAKQPAEAPYEPPIVVPAPKTPPAENP
jgi:glutaredoxin